MDRTRAVCVLRPIYGPLKNRPRGAGKFPVEAGIYVIASGHKKKGSCKQARGRGHYARRDGQMVFWVHTRARLEESRGPSDLCSPRGLYGRDDASGGQGITANRDRGVLSGGWRQGAGWEVLRWCEAALVQILFRFGVLIVCIVRECRCG